MMYNSLFLRIKIIEMDEIVRSPSLIAIARKLTLHPGSGMNHALDYYIRLTTQRSVDAVGIFAEYLSIPIGWSLFTYESDQYSFYPQPGQVCAQVYVDTNYRRLGVGKALLEMATKLARPDTLKVYAWSAPSFFDSFINDSSLNVEGIS
jgi:GNAT superfamily N-acetyltransferase